MGFRQFPSQQAVASLLQRSLENGRLAHAYLFTGPVADDLEVMARTLAKAVNCQDPIRGKSGTAVDSCDHCRSCRQIDADLHPDVPWIRPESKSRIITIAQMREVMQTIHLKPSQAAFKVIVISAADRLNDQAANAFLKTLEEPPASSIIILLSTEPQRLLETILSRCLRLHFAGGIGVKTTPADLEWLGSFSKTAASETSLLGRYRLLGSLLSRLAKLRDEIETELTAKSPLQRHEDIEPALRDRWEDELQAAIEAEYRRRRGESLLALEWWLRDVWLATQKAGKDLASFPALLAEAETLARRVATADSLQNLVVVEQLQKLLFSNVQEALALEVCFLKLKL